MDKIYDVIIPGGGLAGLTLSIQLKRAKPDISILILESMDNAAPTAAHKVGESTVELATHYMREVLDLKGYLEEHELPKHGLRFFFKTTDKNDITNRVELGPRLKLPVPSHQLDRGTLENYMSSHTQSLGSELIRGARAKDVLFSEHGHQVTYSKDGQDTTVKARWIADATGRGSLLKRKLNFVKPMEHHVNAVWWRLKGEIDIDDWSENTTWKSQLEPKLRYLSTVHFMDKGYWVWVIPLGSKNTSIGIVADPAVHPFEDINTYQKSLTWLQTNEPLCYKMLKPRGEGEGLLDFRVLKHFAHDSGQLYSANRWGVVGESGAFLDPLYSPGSDLIALANSWMTDLILRDLAGEDISIRAAVYEKAHLAHIENWIPIYQNKYLLMGNTQIMVFKIFWDWAIYWSVPCLIFTNKGFVNLKVIKELFASPSAIGSKFGELNKRIQQLFIEWQQYDIEIFTNHYIDPFDVPFLQKWQQELEMQYEPKALIEKVKENVLLLEKFAAAMFRLMSAKALDTPMDLKVDPYSICLQPGSGLTSITTGPNAMPPDEEIDKQVDIIWFYNKKTVSS